MGILTEPVQVSCGLWPINTNDLTEQDHGSIELDADRVVDKSLLKSTGVWRVPAPSDSYVSTFPFWKT